jgi:citrate lyase beta subunit
VPVTTLRRSVLSVRLRDADGVPEPWPPPDAGAVPDAVILPGHRDAPIAPALAALGRWGVDVILDTPAGGLASAAHSSVTSVLSIDGLPSDVRETDAALAAIERARGLPAGAIAIELFVTAPRAFLQLDELLATSARITSVITDPAALPAAFGLEASTEVDQFAYPRSRLVLAAAHRRIPAVGLFAPAGLHRAAARELDAAQFSFAIGLHGGLCRTWDEVRACNRGFAPDEARVARARRILDALEEAGRQGLGAISLDGRMIDLPFIQVSEATLRLAEQVAARTEAARQMIAGQVTA